MGHEHAENLAAVQNWLRVNDMAGLIVPSTDEFLSEFAPPGKRRLRWATGFFGSTGAAVVTQDKAALFLDGRYRLQGALDTQGTGIDIQPAAWPERQTWLGATLAPRARLAIDPALHSLPDLRKWQALANALDLELHELSSNPIDLLWREHRPGDHHAPIVDFPERGDNFPGQFAGDSHDAKCAELRAHLEKSGIEALLVADPEDVAWLLNVRMGGDAWQTRVGDWHIVPAAASRALLWRDGRLVWFVEQSQVAPELLARGSSLVQIAAPDQLPEVLAAAAAQGAVGADLGSTPAALTQILEARRGAVHDDVVARRRWHKHPAEIEAARRAHIIDAAAVVRFMAWLVRSAPEQAPTEFAAAERLEAMRREHPDYRGASMPLMSASGPSGAMPHYVPREDACRRVSDHPIYWMDSGGHYSQGGTTDNTFTIALAPPEPEHVLAHTLVLRGFLALAMARFPAGTIALQLDALARTALWRHGMDYAHGTGHGVGNCLNIHEGPSITRDLNAASTTALSENMILSNEPAYYAEHDFGIRIESHLLVTPSRYPGFLEFETISRLPIDPRLIDFAELSRPERQWLANYHRQVLADLGALIDAPSLAWLSDLVDVFESKGR